MCNNFLKQSKQVIAQLHLKKWFTSSEAPPPFLHPTEGSESTILKSTNKEICAAIVRNTTRINYNQSYFVKSFLVLNLNSREKPTLDSINLKGNFFEVFSFWLRIQSTQCKELSEIVIIYIYMYIYIYKIYIYHIIKKIHIYTGTIRTIQETKQ